MSKELRVGYFTSTKKKDITAT